LQAASERDALNIVADEPKRREQLHHLLAFANAKVTERLGIAGSGSQILPIIIGDNDRAVRIAQRLQAEGFDVRAIRPPTVPIGTARLRIAITLNVDAPTIDRLIFRLAQTMAQQAAELS
jgi:8-amino-7-oxononanoate synthase